MIKTEIKQITPDLASSILSKSNINNRPMKLHWVKTLASAINRNEWQLTHQGIAFDKNQMLIDGQHRLMAIVMSGKTVPMIVTTGLEREVFEVVDVHAKRTIGDLTRLPQKNAEICRYAATMLYAERQPSANQVNIIANSGLADIANQLLKFCGTNRAVVTAVPLKLVVCVLADKYPHKTINLFESYKRMANCDYANMTQIESAISRRISNKLETASGGSTSSRLLALGLKLFDEKNANLNRIHITDENIEQAQSEIKNHLSLMVKKYDWSKK